MLGRRQPPLPYHLVIQNYNPYGRGIFWAERFVDELFTSEQAEQLEDYVNRWDGFETKVEEVELPVPIRLARPFSAIPLEKGQGWLQIYKYDDYDLPFSVAGYFDARPVIENDIPWEELSAPVIL